MLKMLIVEDEEILRNGIYKIGNWKEHDIEITGLAKNGVQALEMIKECKPNIVLTDVVMPFMNGLELTQHLHEMYPDIKVIILSGHEEFQYVKTALEYKAQNYLLKPAKIENIVKAVLGVKKEIEQELKKTQEIELIKKKLKESIPVLQNHFLNKLISSNLTDFEEFKRKKDFLNIKINNKNLVVVLFDIDKENNSLEDIEIKNMILQDISKSVFSEISSCCVFQNIFGYTVIISNYENDKFSRNNVKFILDAVSRIQKEMADKHLCSVSVGISRGVESISEIRTAYKEAETALDYRFFIGSSSAIYIGDIDFSENNNYINIEDAEAKILTTIRSGDVNLTSDAIKEYFKSLEQLMLKGPGFIKHEVSALLHNVFRYIRSVNSNHEELSLKEEQLIISLQNKSILTLYEIEKNVIEIVELSMKIICDERKINNQIIAEKAKTYIKNNLSGDISLIAVADAVYVSPNYLSYLFKENGENFKDYVIRKKMEKAEEFLTKGKLNLNQIASRLGYSDGRYFSQVYKKYSNKAKI